MFLATADAPQAIPHTEEPLLEAFIVKSGSLELNKIELKHTGTSEGEKNFIVADANGNVTVDLATVAFVATADNTCFFNVASGATFNLNFVDDGSTFKVNTSTMVATADVFTVTKVEDGADYVGADYYGNNFAAHNRDAYSTVNVTDKNGNALFNIENAIVTKGDETPTYYVATGAGLKTAITSGADYVKLMDDVVGSGESDTDVTVTAKTGDLETVIDLNGKQFGYELNLSTIVLNDAKKYEDTGYTLKVTIKNGKIGTESGYNQDATKGQLYYGVLCQGNGVFLTLENVESSAYYGGLYANGAWKDNVITATDCKFASTIAGYGAYLPGKNTYNFTNCTFTGSVGVYIKSGDATFTDCTIEGKGEYLKPTYNGNGADGEGSGLVVDSTTGYQTPMTVTVNGGSITSANGYAIEEVSNAKDNADKICYSTVSVSKETVLTGKLGKVQSENGTVKVEGEDGTVAAYASTAAAVSKAMENGGNVVLTDDLTCDATEFADTQVTVRAAENDVETVIDLNGKTLGYRLTLTTLDTNSKDTGKRLKVTVKNGQVGTDDGLSAAGANMYYGFNLQGNGVDLVVEDVRAVSYYGGLYANGSWSGNTINAKNCTIEGSANGYGAYLPGKNTYNFTNCTFSGSVGVYIKSGDTTFTDCTINGNGEYEKPTYNGNGANGGGAGVVVDSTTGYQTPMTVTVKGGSITSVNGYAIEEVSNAKANADKICYSTVSVDKTAVLTGKLGKVSSENGTVRVEGENGETTAYASTGAGVVNAMANGGTVVLTDDVTGTGKDTDVTIAAVDGNVETTLDLNGKTLGYELNLSTLTDGKDNGNTLKVTIKNGKIGTESGYSNEDADGKKGTLFYGLLLEGNGLDLTLEKVESSAYYGGLYMNGTWKNYKVVANDCVFNCVAGNAAYFAGYTVAEFNNCTFTGSMGAYAKCGDITFNDCTLTGKLPYEKPTYNGNGANGEGNGFTADSCVGYQQPLTVRFNGGSVTSEYGYAIEEISTAKEGVEKVCYSTVTVSKETVLTGKLGNVQSENGTVTIVA